MKALAVCCTYGRIPYLGRMLSCFLHQEYDDKHLVIINDDKNVELVCDHKEVSVINCSRKLLLSEKRNLGSAYGFYDILFPWDDDDVYLPCRIHNHMIKYSDPEVNAYRNLASYLIFGEKFSTSDGSMNSISCRKDEWFRRRGYQERTRVGEDRELLVRFEGLLVEDDPNTRDFVYNFGGINYHLSYDPSAPIMEQIAYKQLEDRNLIGKKFHIHPDFEEYNKFLWLDKLYKEKQEDMIIKHMGDAKIDISHLL